MAMINIGIVDNEQWAVDNLYGLVKSYFEKENVEHKIHGYLSGIEMLKCTDILDIVFLDIEMPDADGIEIGRRLNEMSPSCTIVMATISKERFKEAFRINAFRYITKPFEREEVWEAVDSYIKKKVGIHTIDVYNDRKLYKIQEKDICYIKAYDGYTLIYSVKGKYRSELSLTDFQEKIDQKIFFRISRSYLVNLLKIDKYCDDKIYIGEEALKISRRNKKGFRVQVIKIDAEYGLRMKIC